MDNCLIPKLYILFSFIVNIVYLIKAVPNVEYQTLLEKRYLCFITWEQIAVDMNYSMQHVHRMHSAALKKIVVPEKDES